MALTKVTGQVIKNTTDVTVGVLTVTNTLAVGGTVSIGGTLTYEDVTNVDAVGLITARNGIVVGSGITLSKDGDIFATGVTTSTTFVGNLTGNVTGTASANAVLTGSTNDTLVTVTGSNAIQGESNLTFNSSNILTATETGTGNGMGGIRAATANATGNAGYGFMTNDANRFAVTLIGSAGAESLRIYDDNNDAEALRIDSAGRVLIGGTSPIIGSSSEFNEIVLTGKTRGSGITLQDVNANVRFQIRTDDDSSGTLGTLLNASTNHDMFFRTNNTERLRITSAGLVGINSTSPTHNLDIHASGNPYLKLLRSGYNPVYIGNAAGEGVIESTGATFIKTGGSERVRIDSSGRVGIKNNIMSSFNDGMDDLVIGNGTNGTSPGMTIYSNSSDIGSISFRDSADTGISGLIQYRHLNSPPYMRFLVEGTETAKFTTHGGIAFGSDTAAVNTLDDYEEGTYTPVFNAGTANITYTVQSGNYVKIGKLVRFDFYIQVNGGVSNGNMIEFNLPMSSAAGTNSHRGSGVITYHNINNGNSGSNDFPALYIGTNSAQCYMGPTQWQAPSGTAQSNRYFIGGGTYHAA